MSSSRRIIIVPIAVPKSRTSSRLMVFVKRDVGGRIERECESERASDDGNTGDFLRRW